MARGSIFHHVSFRSTILQYFTFRSINQKPKNILPFVYLSLSNITFESDREGVDNPFIVLGASCLIVCVDIGDLSVVSYWIDTLVLKTEGNTYTTLQHHPFLFKGKPTQAQEVALGA